MASPHSDCRCVGQKRIAILLGFGISYALFALAHTPSRVIGFLDALYFSALRLRSRTVSAAVLARGFNNTIGLVTLPFCGPHLRPLVIFLSCQATEVGAASDQSCRAARIGGDERPSTRLIEGLPAQGTEKNQRFSPIDRGFRHQPEHHKCG
jgi:hypothetical protein